MIRLIWQLSSLALASIGAILFYRYANGLVNAQIGPMLDFQYINIMSPTYRFNIGAAGFLICFGLLYVFGIAVADAVQTSVIVGNIKEVIENDGKNKLTRSSFLANFPSRGLLTRSARDYAKSIAWQSADPTTARRPAQMGSARTYFLDNHLLSGMNGDWLPKTAMALGLTIAVFKFMTALAGSGSIDPASVISIGFLFFSIVFLYFLSLGSHRLRALMMTRLAKNCDLLFDPPASFFSALKRQQPAPVTEKAEITLKQAEIDAIAKQLDERISGQLDTMAGQAEKIVHQAEKSIEKTGRAVTSAKKLLTEAVSSTLNLELTAANKKQQNALKKMNDVQLKETKSLKTLLNDITTQTDKSRGHKSARPAAKSAKVQSSKTDKSKKPAATLSPSEVKALKALLKDSKQRLADLPAYKIN